MPKRSSRVTSSSWRPQRSVLSMCSLSWKSAPAGFCIPTRRVIPRAEWTLQQFRECVTGEEPYKFIIHDRDSIYSKELDSSLRSLGLRVLRTPYRSPQANAFCERLIGSARRECLDFMIPLNESHIRIILKPRVAHFNEGRPHSS